MAASLSEELVWELAHRLVAPPGELARRGVLVGPGDDCAILALPAGEAVALTTDCMVEGVHFKLSSGTTTLADVGYKIAARSLSDLAACGALPHSILVTLGLPAGASPHEVEEFMAGLSEALREGECLLVGGDVHRAPHWTTCSTALGTLPAKPWLRSALTPGMVLYISGPLGLAEVGIALLTGKLSPGDLPGKLAGLALSRINRPRPRLDLVKALGGQATPAAIDLSDSLSRCLIQLAEASGVEVEVYAERIPAHPDALPVLAELAGMGEGELSPQERAALLLASSEDYELLLGLTEEDAKKVAPEALGLIPIGRVRTKSASAPPKVVLVSEQGEEELAPTGYQHF